SLTSSRSCDTLKNWFYDESSQSCCYQCPSGYVKKKACPSDPDEDCMRCGPEQYVNKAFQKPQCDACVSVSLCYLTYFFPTESDLVEKEPCSFNSSRVCECRPGLFCLLPVVNTCIRCQQHTVCQPGFGVKVRGTSTNDVTCEECPSGTFSDQNSSTDICKPHTNCTALNKVALGKGNATHDQVCLDALPTYLTPSTLSMRFSNKTNNSELRRLEENLVTITSVLLSATTENPSSTPEKKVLPGTFPTSAKGETTTGGVVLWGVILSAVVLLVGMLLFWKWKVCKKRMFILKGKREFLRLTVVTFMPLLLSALCWQKLLLTADSGPEEELTERTPSLETNNNLVSSTEKTYSPDLSLADVTQSSGSAPDCPVDTRVRDHTNNRIEKIYIMKADTVIVGSISEVPSGKNCAARACESNEDAQESVEEEMGMHYPEQETESFPGNDVMVPVEEEGKEFRHPTTATEK
ncbi:TNR8 factor, partial [Zapornia atra]|nr:TNR8 factor [Zapornia atra]